MPQAIVVGAGVVGLSCAVHLRRKGFDVLVVDAGSVGGAASFGNAGWIVPALSAPVASPGAFSFGLRSMLQRGGAFTIRPVPSPSLIRWGVRFARAARSKPFASGLAATAVFASQAARSFETLVASGLQTPVHSRGMLIAYESAAEAEAELAAYSGLRQFGVALREAALGPTELQSVEPALGRLARAGILFPDEQFVDPHLLTLDLSTLAQQEGVEVRENTRVAKLSDPRDPRVHLSDGSLLQDATVVIAAGSESPGLLLGLGYRLPMQPGKGLSVTVKPTTAVGMPVYIPAAKAAITPLNSGMRIAGVMELGAKSLEISTQRLGRMVSSAEKYFVSDFQVTEHDTAWAGLRPVTADSLPVIGAVPGTNRTFVATGHAMLGVTLGPLTGEIIAELAIGNPQSVAEPFNPNRFLRKR